MAEPTPENGTPPLTENEQKQLDALIAKRDAATVAQAEKTRQEKLASLAPVEALIKLIKTDKITAAMDTVMNDAGIDFDTKQKIRNLRESMTYNLDTLGSLIDSLKSPTPTPTPTA